MSYNDAAKTYRCEKMDFHSDTEIVITVGICRFHGRILQADDEIDKAYVMIIMRKSDFGSVSMINEAEITVHSKEMMK